jgi:hypothetical protein
MGSPAVIEQFDPYCAIEKAGGTPHGPGLRATPGRAKPRRYVIQCR